MDLDFIRAQPRLERSPLKTVICQVRYPTQLGFSDSRLRPVQRKLASSYPRVEVAQLNEMRVDASGVTPLATEQVFHLRDDSSTWTVAISRTFMSLETSSYGDFPDFLRRWHTIVSVVADELDLERQERIGLRYVNEVPVARNPTITELKRTLNDAAVGMVGQHATTQNLMSSMQELRFAQDQGTCTVRHGLIPRQDDAVYVLDLDLYDDVARELDVESQARLLASFNHKAFELFQWFWTPEQFKDFEPKDPT